MVFDFTKFSDKLINFLGAFTPETYGRSSSRATVEYEKLSPREKEMVTAWFIELFEQEKDYYDNAYLLVAEKTGDKRFIPLIRAYEKRLKKQRNKPTDITQNGKTLTVRPQYTAELALCAQVLQTLEQQE